MACSRVNFTFTFTFTHSSTFGLNFTAHVLADLCLCWTLSIIRSVRQNPHAQASGTTWLLKCGGKPPAPRNTSSIQRGVQEMLGIYYMAGHSTLELRSKPLAIAPGKLFAHLEGETRQCQVHRFTAYQLTSHTTYNPDCWHRIHNSLVGYRQDHQKGLLICISSPLTQQDKSLSLLHHGFWEKSALALQSSRRYVAFTLF